MRLVWDLRNASFDDAGALGIAGGVRAGVVILAQKRFDEGVWELGRSIGNVCGS